MLNWIVLNGTVFDIETTYGKLNCLKYNCFDISLYVNKNFTYTKLTCLN